MKTCNYLSLAVFVLFFFSLQACKNKNETNNPVTTDLVNNPSTASGEVVNDKVPIMVLEKEEHAFGKISEGEKISYAFKFKNTGNANLVISDAKGSCGCTVPEWTKDPIAPGASGVVNVTFDSRGKTGMQHKTITLITNAIPNTKVLTISGEVIPAGS
jgi:hypothetical protein